jgi:TonB family protein
MDDKDRLAGMPASIGRYQIVDAVGVGAMGAVYKAFDPLIKRTLAIKTIRLDIPRNSPQYSSFIERFQHEARISGTLSHPNIVTLFDIGEEGGLPFLAMEFVEGETISSMLDRGHRFRPEKVIALVSQIASAIDYAHTRGVVHRDIKPSNLIISEADKVKVTDFGIAKLVDAEMTQSGQLLGTPSYMSPEQAMGDKLDGRSDIFSLGVCAFEMLSGEQPFPGNNVTSILYKLVHVEPVQPANLEMNGLVPQKWHEVFGKVLAKRPDERYQTGAAFVHDLEYCLGSWFGAAMGDEVEEPLEVVNPTAVPAARPPAPAPPPIPIPPPLPIAPPAAAPPPPPEPEGEAKTVILKSPPAPVPVPDVVDSPAAVLLDEPESDVPVTIMMKAPTPPAAEADVPATVVMKAPPAPSTGPPPPPAPARRATAAPVPPPPAPGRPRGPETPPPTITATSPLPVDRPGAQAPAKKGGGPPLAAIFGVLALLALVVVGGVVLLYLRSFAGKTDATPSPTVAEAPSPTVVPTGAPPAGATDGALRVETTPPGATVVVDGQPRGVTPLEVPGLAFGAHELKVELAGHDAQVQPFTLSAESARADLKFTLGRSAPGQGTVDVVSSPPGASVTIDGQPAGTTPLSGLTLKAGRHRIALSLAGHEPWSGTFSVQGGRTARVDRPLAALAVQATPVPSPKVADVDTSRIYENGRDVDVPAKRLTGATASYPDRAPRLKSGQEVAVALRFVVTETGEVKDVEVVESGGPLVDQAVMQAVSNWRYSPAVKRGTTVKVRVQFRQRFRAG